MSYSKNGQISTRGFSIWYPVKGSSTIFSMILRSTIHTYVFDLDIYIDMTSIRYIIKPLSCMYGHTKKDRQKDNIHALRSHRHKIQWSMYRPFLKSIPVNSHRIRLVVFKQWAMILHYLFCTSVLRFGTHGGDFRFRICICFGLGLKKNYSTAHCACQQ